MVRWRGRWRVARRRPATTLVEKHDAIPLRIEKPGGRAVAACTRPAMHDDDRLAGERAVLLPIDPMLGKSGRRQIAGPDEGWVRRLVVWRGRLGACIHGNYFCDMNGSRQYVPRHSADDDLRLALDREIH